MARFAIVVQGKVHEIITADRQPEFASLIPVFEVPQEVEVGWDYVDGKFCAPPPPPSLSTQNKIPVTRHESTC